ncbi:hypothetical protein [Sulfurimonas sp. NWX79]|uniref:hypothetical protein n=1 Tax=Campylobacterales TaxID=213849 RepID=UPI0032048FE1|nr:hypothetical protein IAPFLPAM_00054 [Sulfurimonas phage SNW-1]
MAGITFRRGSTPYTLHTHFSEGKSLTYDEAYEIGIRHLTQRVADLKKKFEDAGVASPLMVIDESNQRGGNHARYFYAGSGCHLENKPGVRRY